MRILFVEDNVNTVRAMKAMLELRGYSVDTAASVSHAKECLRSSAYDVLISDIRLPDGSGYDLLPLLPTSDCSIALSGFTTEADRQEALTKGFSAFISKPFKTEELIAEIESIAQR